VEVAFGAVRLFDVDGRRVEAGALRRSERNRVISLPVPNLADGTYTVTWRVASSDGHPVFGGFDFYVGAPSAISAVAVRPDQGTGDTVRWGFGVVRALWFGSLIGLVGMVAARRWVWTPAVRAAGLGASPAGASFRSGFRAALPGAWVVLAVTGLLWMVFEGATLAGLSVWSAARPEVLGEVLRTNFGRYWGAGLLLTVAAVIPIVALTRRTPVRGIPPAAWIGLLGVLVTGICLTSALSGHARTEAVPALTVPSVAAHLLAVGVWVGGLGALVLLGGRAWRRLPADERPRLVAELVPRFSRLAIGGVILVVLTGTVNALAGLGPISNLWKVAYGRVLSAKVILLAVALVLAARHLRVVPRRLDADKAGTDGTVASFRRSAGAELVVLCGAVALAAALVALVPGRSLAEAERGPVNQQRQVGAYTAQLVIDPSAVGDNEVHLTFANSQGLAAGEVSNTVVALGAEGEPLRPLEMRLIAPGHFVVDTTLRVPGRYRMSVTAGSGSSGASNPSTTFEFRIPDP
jgi:copper transport protein